MKLHNLFLILSLVLTLLVTACAATTSANDAADPGASGPAKRIVFYNWADYIDPAFYDEFEAETGIEVVEDNFASYEELLAKFQGGATGYALIVADSRTINILNAESRLAELDHANIPNLSNLYERFRTLSYDEGNTYCAAYQWGVTGLGYNKDEMEAPNSWAALFEPNSNAPAYGRTTMLDDVREVFGAALIYLGYDVNTTDEAQLKEAQQLLIKAKAGLTGYDSTTFHTLLGSGENLLAHGWNGSFMRVMDQPDGANVGFVVPKEGSLTWIDHLCIPANTPADQKLAAEMFINFLLRPEIGARLSARNFYASPNQAAEAHLDKEFLNSPIIYPPAEVTDKLHYLLALGEFEGTYLRLWNEVKAASVNQ
jgi:spermidine/putrescine transport system substrate-binding protein